MKTYVKRISNGTLFDTMTHGHLVGTDGYALCDVNGNAVGNSVPDPSATIEESAPVDADRLTQIIEAVSNIDPATFSQRPGRTPMPRVDAVSALVGYKVTGAEVEMAMKAINGGV